MNTIKLSEVKKEIKKVKKIIKDYYRIDKEARQVLTKLGYTQENLGTGLTAYTKSKDVKVMDINSNSIRYLSGKYLVIGISNTRNGKGVLYRGFVKKII